MKENHRGKQSLLYPVKPVIHSYAAVAGKKEAEGPLGYCFDHCQKDTSFGQRSWEKAETQMQKQVFSLALEKGQMEEGQLEAVFTGDLLNQCVGSSFSMRNRKIPTFGLYGACSTMAESLLLAGMGISGGFFSTAMALTSSHFASSERQYRFPLNYGGQRTPTAQWTVTGAGGVILTQTGPGPQLLSATVGSIVDLGIRDANNMGAAMAPAAYETIRQHFEDLSVGPEDYDLIVTGDLGKLGFQIVTDLFRRDGVVMGQRYQDCGMMIYDLEKQDVHCGGSGCGCSASVLCGYLLPRMERKDLRRLLFCGTGALLSPLTVQQGESIPAVCHAVSISVGEE